MSCTGDGELRFHIYTGGGGLKGGSTFSLTGDMSLVREVDGGYPLNFYADPQGTQLTVVSYVNISESYSVPLHVIGDPAARGSDCFTLTTGVITNLDGTAKDTISSASGNLGVSNVGVTCAECA